MAGGGGWEGKGCNYVHLQGVGPYPLPLALVSIPTPPGLCNPQTFGWLTVPPPLGERVLLTSQPEACPAQVHLTGCSIISNYPVPKTFRSGFYIPVKYRTPNNELKAGGYF